MDSPVLNMGRETHLKFQLNSSRRNPNPTTSEIPGGNS